ncbi:phage tail protein, partial [Arsenophonus nasoniae]|uniref:phage tail protein n=1 Tax=Arsenophonus nasoniae TaxID=638 RepID=UPI0038794DB3
YQNGIAEYAEKQIYNKGAVCLSDGNIYLSKTENNAGNPVTDTTQWQSLKDAILGANIVQQIGNATDKVTSQKLVTDALNGKQPKGDYATKTDLTQGLNTKLNSSNVKQTTGNSTTEVMSQKAVTDAISDNGVPVGTIIMLAHKSEPKGRYLKANGVAVSRQKYYELFEVIGTNYGAGDGSTTFNLPDLRDEFPRFAGDNREIGSKQGDAIRKITGKWNGGVKNKKHTDGSVRFIKDRIWGIDGELTSEDTDFNNGNSPTEGWDAYELDSSLEVPTADENRPRNIALVGWIKY